MANSPIKASKSLTATPWSGYSMVELLVVMGILMLLMGSLLAMSRRSNSEGQVKQAMDGIGALIREGATTAASSKDFVVLVRTPPVRTNQNDEIVLYRYSYDQPGATEPTLADITSKAAEYAREGGNSVEMPQSMRIAGNRGVLLGFRMNGTVIDANAPSEELTRYFNPSWTSPVRATAVAPNGNNTREIDLYISRYGDTKICDAGVDCQ